MQIQNALVRETKVFPIDSLTNLPTDTPYHLVLSGGGEKGVAHIAFLEKLEQLGIEIHSISATSAGSLVGSMYASGMPLKKILNFFLTTPLFHYSWMNIRKPGVFDSHRYRELIIQHIKPTFKDLNLPLYVTTTNLEENVPYYFHKGDLVNPVLASCAVPAVFNPIEIGGQLHADGGVMDNFPTYPFKDSSIPILGSYVGFAPKVDKIPLNTIFNVSSHSAQLKSFSSEFYKFDKTVYTAVFPLENFNAFDAKMALPIYRKACNFLEL